PLYWEWGGAIRSTTVVGNIYSRPAPDGDAFGIVPLYFHGRSEKSGYDLVPPLLAYHGWDADSALTVIGPYFKSEDATGYHAGVLPFYFTGRHGDEEYDTVAPLFWRGKSGPREHITLFPFFDYRTSPEGSLFSSPLVI